MLKHKREAPFSHNGPGFILETTCGLTEPIKVKGEGTPENLASTIAEGLTYHAVNIRPDIVGYFSGYGGIRWDLSEAKIRDK